MEMLRGIDQKNEGTFLYGNVTRQWPKNFLFK